MRYYRTNPIPQMNTTPRAVPDAASYNPKWAPIANRRPRCCLSSDYRSRSPRPAGQTTAFRGSTDLRCAALFGALRNSEPRGEIATRSHRVSPAVIRPAWWAAATRDLAGHSLEPSAAASALRFGSSAGDRRAATMEPPFPSAPIASGPIVVSTVIRCPTKSPLLCGARTFPARS
jgi:hypothetical protein